MLLSVGAISSAPISSKGPVLNITGSLALTQGTSAFAVSAFEIFSSTLALTQPISSIDIAGNSFFLSGSLALHQAIDVIAITAQEAFTAAIALTQPANSIRIASTTDSLTRWHFDGPTSIPRRKAAAMLTQIRQTPPILNSIRTNKARLEE